MTARAKSSQRTSAEGRRHSILTATGGWRAQEDESGHIIVSSMKAVRQDPIEVRQLLTMADAVFPGSYDSNSIVTETSP